MGKYFLIKEHNYEKTNFGCFLGTDAVLLPGYYNDYNIALEEAKTSPIGQDDTIHIVEVVAKRHGFAPIVSETGKVDDVCPECGSESLSKSDIVKTDISDTAKWRMNCIRPCSGPGRFGKGKSDQESLRNKE